MSSQVRVYVRLPILQISPPRSEVKVAVPEVTLAELRNSHRYGYKFGLRLALYVAKTCNTFTSSPKQVQALKKLCRDPTNIIPDVTRAGNLINDNAEKRLIALHKTKTGQLYSKDVNHIY